VWVFNQIRAVDRRGLIKRLGVADEDTMARADESSKISLGLIKV
jgi:mRNA-degrading endonuclease toxin of MazEF toxin-antitoxin module